MNTVILQLARLIESPFWRIHGLFSYSSPGGIYRSETSRTLVCLHFFIVTFDSRLTVFVVGASGYKNLNYNFHAHTYSVPKTFTFFLGIGRSAGTKNLTPIPMTINSIKF